MLALTQPDWNTLGLVVIIVVAITTSVTIPLFLTRRMDREHRRDRLEDFARQDAVADQAAEAAKLLKVNNQLVADTALETQKSLTVIRADVNSNLTAQFIATRDATAAQLATMHRLIVTPDESEVALMAHLSETVAELNAVLRDRQAG